MNEGQVETASKIVRRESILSLARDIVSIPSCTFEESRLAHHLADRMKEIGMHVELQEIKTPQKFGGMTHQVVGTLKGSREGPKLLFCGHLDYDYWNREGWDRDPYEAPVQDGWLFGAGIANMKGGDASMLGAIEAIAQSDLDLKGDLIFAGVMGEMIGGIGVQHLLDSGITADYGIVAEPTNLKLITKHLGVIRCLKINVIGRRGSPGGRRGLLLVDPIEKMMEVMRALGPTKSPIRPGRWMTFKPNSKYPNFPVIVIGSMEAGLTNEYDKRLVCYIPDHCCVRCDVKISPGQEVTDKSIQEDLRRLFQTLKSHDPELNVDCEVVGFPEFRSRKPFEMDEKEHIIQTVAHAHHLVTGQDDALTDIPMISDAGCLCNAGIPTALYGPGGGGEFNYGSNEKVRIDDMVTAARVFAMTALDLCGVS